MESTVRYLGIEVEDALEMSEQTEIRMIRKYRWPLDSLPIVTGHPRVPCPVLLVAEHDCSAQTGALTRHYWIAIAIQLKNENSNYSPHSRRT